MTQREHKNTLLVAIVWLTAGLALVALAWMIPVNLKSVTPALLRAAGENTPGVAAFGQQRLDSEKLGAARLIHEAAKLVNDPAAPALERSLQNIETRRPEWVPWGGWDPFLDPLVKMKENTGRTQSTPVLTFFITEKARRSLESFLSNSRSLGVQSILQTREIQGTTRFVPANRPGGEALDATILLTALLYQSENLSPALQRELRTLAETAAAEKQMGALETFYLDLLSLGKRLNWMQLCELLRVTGGTATVAEFAQLTRVASDNLPLIYTAALFSGSADDVAHYLMEYGKQGLADLRLALATGQGSVQLLLRNRAPVNHTAGPSLNAAAELALLNPRAALIAKYAAFFFGAFFLFHAVEVFISGIAYKTTVGDATAIVRLPPVRLRSGLLAAMIAVFLVFASEPFLIKTPPPSEFKFKLFMPVLNFDQPDSPITPVQVTTAMLDNATILTIAIFAALQVAVYIICLLKIRSIARQPIAPQLKLRLMENEENLFDAGLYVGIAGTATGLVLQVMGVVQANLLAAYSSNLFGILCVALVKIRHVRNFKRQLIIESQGGAGLPPSADASAKPATTNF